MDRAWTSITVSTQHGLRPWTGTRYATADQASPAAELANAH
jgi:hypothetical protein